MNTDGGPSNRMNSQVYPLNDRIREAVAPSSIAEVARKTGFNTETVRRYCYQSVPSLAFILSICEIWDLNANWVLFGNEPRHGRDLKSQIMAIVSMEQVETIQACLMVHLGGEDADSVQISEGDVIEIETPTHDSPPVITIRSTSPSSASQE